MAASPRKYFKASPWELEDAEEEQVEIVINHAPKRFVIEDGKLTGMSSTGRGTPTPRQSGPTLDTVFIPCDDGDPRHRPGERVPLDRARHRPRVRQVGHAKVDKKTFMSTRPGVFFGGDAAWGPENIIWAVEHGHQAAISIHHHCQGVPLTERRPTGMTWRRAPRWACTSGLQQRLQPAKRQKMKHVDLPGALQEA
jgi:formate dehydrogenase beta subunit